MDAVLDTNSLIYASKQKIDVYNLVTELGYDPILLSCVAKELESLTTDAEKGVDKRAAKLALEIARKNSRKVETPEGYADKLILDYAKEKCAMIITNDKALRRKAKSLSIVALSISKNKLLR